MIKKRTKQQKIEILESAKLYGIVDAGYVKWEQMAQTAELLLDAEIRVLQLRAKGHSPEEIKPLAKKIQMLCQQKDAVFIVNDYPEIALEVGADGVHLGQDDGDYALSRQEVGDGFLIGRSTHSPKQAQQAQEDGFDYIGFGPLFETPTKKGRPGIGLENVQQVQGSIGKKMPVFCIGGIKEKNVAQVLKVGAERVVIVSDILASDDIKKKCKTLLTMLDQTTQARQEG